MSAKKILIIPSWYPNKENANSGIFIKHQAEALCRNGGCVSVFYSNIQFKVKNVFQKTTLKKELIASIPTYTVEGMTFPKITIYLLDLWVKKNLEHFETYKREEGLPDIIHAHSFIAGYLSMKISAKYSIPYVLTEHFSGFLTDNIDIINTKTIKTVYPKAKNLIAVSTSLKLKMKKYTSNQIEVIGNMYNDNVFKYKEVKKNRTFTFVTIGGLDDVKGYSLLIDTFNLLLEEEQDIKLIIIGGGVNYSKLSKQIHRLGINDKVKMLGPLDHDDIPNQLYNCHSYVSSSTVETFGISLIEALAVGLPIVSTNSLGPMDYLDDSNSIISIDNTIEALSNAMAQMISLYKDFDMKQISTEINKRYSASVVCHEIFKLY